MNFETHYKSAYIFGFGVAGKWLSDNINLNVKGFLDNNLKINGLFHNEKKVFSPEQIKDKIKPDDLIIITVLDIQDVVPVINKIFPNNQWIALGEKLENQKAKINTTNQSDEFIEYTLKGVESCHKSFLNKDRKFLHSVDIVISEKCTLNCKDCSNLMQYYEDAKNLDYEMVVNDFNELTSKIEHVYEVRLIGGEPFVNKDIYRIIDFFNESNKITKLVIYSNATIPLKPELMKKYANPKLVFSITDYGNLSKNTKRVTDVLDDMNIAYRSLPPNNWTDSAKIQDFERSEEGMVDIFERCCGKNLFTIMYGKLYRCPFAANSERLNAIPLSKDNSVDVSASIEEIASYTNDIKYLPACNFCNGRSHDAPEIVPAIQAKGKLSYKKYINIVSVK